MENKTQVGSSLESIEKSATQNEILKLTMICNSVFLYSSNSELNRGEKKVNFKFIDNLHVY